MHIIKKYANRKLYHTNRKNYITLEGIALLVQAGEQVQVLDNETGEDITASVLVQVILQTRERSAESLPINVLRGLIQRSGDAFAGLRHGLFVSLGGDTFMNEEIRRRLAHLAHEHIIDDQEMARLEHLLLDQATMPPDETASTDAAVPALPSRSDIAHLHAQIDALALAVEQLANQHS